MPKMKIPSNKNRDAFERIDETKLNDVLYGLQYQRVPGDGHCLFHAIGLYLGHDAAFLRKIVADHMEANFATFKPYRQGSNKDFRNYIQAIRNGKEWGDNIEIEIIQRITNRPVIIIRPDANPTIPGNLVIYQGDPIFIYYNGYNHYDAFIIEGDNIGPKKILANIQNHLAKGKLVTYKPIAQFREHSTSSLANNSSTLWADTAAKTSTIPEEYLCPLTRQPFKDPVLLVANGTIYERAALQKHFIESNGIIPKTNTKLSKEEQQRLIAMPAIKKSVEIYNNNERKLQQDHLKLSKTKQKLLIHRIVSNAVKPSNIRYKKELGDLRFSKRKLNDKSKEDIETQLRHELLHSNYLSRKPLSWLEKNQKALQKRLALSLVWKLHPERNWVIRDKEDDKIYGKQTFETMGIVWRNSLFGDDDGEIILKTLKARIALALDNVEFSDESLKDEDFESFNTDEFNVVIANDDNTSDSEDCADAEEYTNSDTGEGIALNADMDDESSVESKKYR